MRTKKEQERLENVRRIEEERRERERQENAQKLLAFTELISLESRNVQTSTSSMNVSYLR